MRKLTPKRINYKQDYISYWNNKGEYDEERVRRMLIRKRKRWSKLVHSCKCGNTQKSTLHTCPFKTDMNDDYDSLCRCCSDCTHECAMDI